MREDGIEFFKGVNHSFLTDDIDKKYIKQI